MRIMMGDRIDAPIILSQRNPRRDPVQAEEVAAALDIKGEQACPSPAMGPRMAPQRSRGLKFAPSAFNMTLCCSTIGGTGFPWPMRHCGIGLS
jgi:hypothetical protein